MRVDGGLDPRKIITPDAFQVAPELLGLPLAAPWRRAAAILFDLLLVAILANARAVFFAVAAGVFVSWLAVRRSPARKPSLVRRVARGTFGCMGGLALTVVGLVGWFIVSSDPDQPLLESSGVPVILSDIGDLATVAGSDDSADVSDAARRLTERLLAEESTTPATALRTDTLGLDDLLAAYSDSRARGDSAAGDRLARELGSRLGGAELAERDARISALESGTDRMEQQLAETRRELDEERKRGLLSSVIGLLDDVGLGLGWSGLYFTFFLGFWKGRTPGKRLLGVRIVRLDGRPLGYWVSFERFGGYAASLFTGLEGFARILWDRNRQALEDKLAETVVVRDTAEARRRVTELHARHAGAGAGSRRPLRQRLSRG